MATTPRRTTPLLHIWNDWATAGLLAILSGNPVLIDLHLKATFIAALKGAMEAKYGPSPAGTGGSTTKD